MKPNVTTLSPSRCCSRPTYGTPLAPAATSYDADVIIIFGVEDSGALLSARRCNIRHASLSRRLRLYNLAPTHVVSYQQA